MIELLYRLLASFGLAAVGTIVVRATARRLGFVAVPREDRWHEKPTALYGGVAIAAAVAVSLFTFGPLTLWAQPQAAAIVAAAMLLFVVGLVDDARGIGPVGKFILQLVACTLLVTADLIYPLTPWNVVNVLVTLFWFVGIVNALNLLDNMDGVTAGVAAIASAAFGVGFASHGNMVLAAVALTAAGAAAGFLIFNFKPATIFMGDGGSLLLGAVLAGLGVAYPTATGTYGPGALLVPALILVVPIMDTALVTVTRTIHNRRISVGGRDHSTHRLVAMGFSESQAAVFLYGVALLFSVVALSIQDAAPAVILSVGLSFLSAAVLFTAYLGRLHRYGKSHSHDRAFRGELFRNLLLKRRGLVLLLDVILFGVAYYGSFLIYHEGALPSDMAATAGGTLALVIVLKLAAFHYFRVYKGVWERTGLADVHRIIKAVVLGELFVIGTLFLVDRGAGAPRTVFVLDLLLSGALATAARSSFGSLDRFRSRLQSGRGEPVLIYGAGPEADLVLMSLRVREEYESLRPVGFIDGVEPAGTLVRGIPVLGSPARIAEILEETRARTVILSRPLLAHGQAASFHRICRDRGVELLVSEFSLRKLSALERGAPQSRAHEEAGVRSGGAGGNGRPMTVPGSRKDNAPVPDGSP